MNYGYNHVFDNLSKAKKHEHAKFKKKKIQHTLPFAKTFALN